MFVCLIAFISLFFMFFVSNLIVYLSDLFSIDVPLNVYFCNSLRVYFVHRLCLCVDLFCVFYVSMCIEMCGFSKVLMACKVYFPRA